MRAVHTVASIVGKTSTALPVRLLHPAEEAASLLGISVRKLFYLTAMKELHSVRVGRRRLWPRVELERFSRRGTG